MLTKEMAKIDFTKSVNEIKNKVYGLNPIMGAYAMYEAKKVKFWKIEVLDYNVASEILEKEVTDKIQNGEIILSNDKLGLYIKANGGVIKVIEIQGENAKRMKVCDFLRGNKIEEGKSFI